MLAPAGIGILYGKEKLLESLQPVSFGGGMVDLVTNEDSSWNRIPCRFEAGTPNIAGITGPGAAISYLKKNGVVSMRRYEKEILTYALEKLEGIPGVKILGHHLPSITQRKRRMPSVRQLRKSARSLRNHKRGVNERDNRPFIPGSFICIIGLTRFQRFLIMFYTRERKYC